MAYPLKALLKIRRHREQTALNQLQQANQVVLEARLLKKKRKEQLSAYIQWRKDEEQRLFEKLRQRLRKRHQVQSFIQQIEHLHEKQNSLVALLKQAEQSLGEAEKKLNVARMQYAQSYREKLKIEEHRQICKREAFLRAERRAEDELDEYNVTRCVEPN